MVPDTRCRNVRSPRSVAMKPLVALMLLLFAAQAPGRTVRGSLDVQWNAGAADCAATPQAPLQVHVYEAQTFILRQSPCADFAANFLYLLVGSDRALLLEPGAVTAPARRPLAITGLGLLHERNTEERRSDKTWVSTGR